VDLIGDLRFRATAWKAVLAIDFPHPPEGQLGFDPQALDERCQRFRARWRGRCPLRNSRLVKSQISRSWPSDILFWNFGAQPKIVRNLRNLFAGLRCISFLVKESTGDGGSPNISSTVFLNRLQFIRTHFLTFSANSTRRRNAFGATGQIVPFAVPVVKIVQCINCHAGDNSISIHGRPRFDFYSEAVTSIFLKLSSGRLKGAAEHHEWA